MNVISTLEIGTNIVFAISLVDDNSKRGKRMNNSSRSFSYDQEKSIAKMVGGRVQSNSGGTITGGGDVHTQSILIEAKTPMSPRSSFSVKEEWLKKAAEQAFEQNKPHYSLAFRFSPDGCDYFVISSRLFSQLVSMLEEEDA